MAHVYRESAYIMHKFVFNALNLEFKMLSVLITRVVNLDILTFILIIV